MLQGYYYPNDPNGPNLELKYPVRAKKGVDLMKVDDKEHAIRLWHLRSRKYIFETLRGWTMQRKVAFRFNENHFNNAVANKDQAADRILHMLLSHYESALPLLCLRVKQARKDIECIAPSASSRFLSHYEEVIKPMVDWCEEYSDSVYRKKVSNN
jgi:hypothetical protein